MARMSRIKFNNPRDGYYHIMSRTVLKSFLLDDDAKGFFLYLVKLLSRVYFTRVATFTIMSNHFHLIVQMRGNEEISDDDLKRRFHIYYNEGKPKKWWRKFHKKDAAHLRERFGDISCFVQDLKQRFSRWYNRKTDGHGHIWSERFKSVILEDSQALLACMVYVELNPLRAGIVEKPEDYRFSGISHILTRGKASNWLDYSSLSSVLSIYDGVKEDRPVKKVLKRYLELIYKAGMIEKPGTANISEKTAERMIASDFVDSGVLSFRRRIRYFTDGVILGSKEYCETKFKEFQPYFKTKKKNRKGHIIKPKKKTDDEKLKSRDLLDIYSIKQFSV